MKVAFSTKGKQVIAQNVVNIEEQLDNMKLTFDETEKAKEWHFKPDPAKPIHLMAA